MGICFFLFFCCVDQHLIGSSGQLNGYLFLPLFLLCRSTFYWIKWSTKCVFVPSSFSAVSQVLNHSRAAHTLFHILDNPAQLAMINCTAGFHRASTVSGWLHGKLHALCLNLIDSDFSYFLEKCLIFVFVWEMV